MTCLESLKTCAALLSCTAALVAACAASPACAATKTLVVEAGKYGRSIVPMGVEVPAGTVGARMEDGMTNVPCQVADGRLWWMIESLPAGTTKGYTVHLEEAAAAPAGKSEGVEVKQTKDALDILIDGKPFATYCFTNPKVGAVQTRRPYFYPVFGPNQTGLMRPWPIVPDAKDTAQNDHPHHTSLWVAYGEVNGVDNWSNAAKAGWQVHRSFENLTSGPVFGGFRETLDWTDADRKPNLAEVRTVRVWRLGPGARMLDLTVTLRAQYGAVTFGDTKEGGVCSTRMRTELRGDKFGSDGRLVLSSGQAGEAAWGKPADWCDASGLVDGRRVGYAIFDAPGNPGFPTRWHARTYGLLSTNPFAVASFEKGAAKKEVTLESGKDMTFRYRIYFHEGDEKQAGVSAHYTDWAAPPAATLK